ncbi:MAG: methyltransferase domain-containing protein [Microgenomates group bacterium]
MKSGKYIVEIGSKYNPIGDNLREEVVGSGQLLLVDKRHWGKRLTEDGIGPKVIPYYQAEAQALPFASSSIETVVEKDVFCADSETADTPKDGMVIERVGNREVIAREIYRVLKPEGRAVLVETLTPTEELVESLKTDFVNAGFKTEKILHRHEIAEIFEGEPRPYTTLAQRNATAIIYRK